MVFIEVRMVRITLRLDLFEIRLFLVVPRVFLRHVIRDLKKFVIVGKFHNARNTRWESTLDALVNHTK